jgi:hypothetical protein
MSQHDKDAANQRVAAPPQPKPGAKSGQPGGSDGQPGNAGKGEKMYPQSAVTEMQRTNDLKVRDLEFQVRTKNSELEKAQQQVSELQGQATEYKNTIDGLKLAPDEAAKVQFLVQRGGELKKKEDTLTAKEGNLAEREKPVKMAELKAEAERFATKSKGQIKVEDLIAQGDVTKMKDYWFDHYNPDAAEPPDKEQPDGQKTDESGEADSELPGLPGSGGTPGKNEDTDLDYLKKTYPNSPQMWK